MDWYIREYTRQLQFADRHAPPEFNGSFMQHLDSFVKQDLDLTQRVPELSTFLERYCLSYDLAHFLACSLAWNVTQSRDCPEAFWHTPRVYTEGPLSRITEYRLAVAKALKVQPDGIFRP